MPWQMAWVCWRCSITSSTLSPMLRPWAVWAPRNPKLPQAMGAGTAASCTWKAGGVRSFDPSWGSCCLAIHQIAWSSKTPGLLGPPRQWLLPNPLTSRSAFFEPPWFQPIPSTQLRGYNRYRIYRYFCVYIYGIWINTRINRHICKNLGYVWCIYVAYVRPHMLLSG